MATRCDVCGELYRNKRRAMKCCTEDNVIYDRACGQEYHIDVDDRYCCCEFSALIDFENGRNCMECGKVFYRG